MAFIDRLDPANIGKSISFHTLTSAMYLVATGMFTVAQFKSGLGLDPSDDAQVDQLVVHFQGLSATDKLAFPHQLESLGILWHAGILTKAQFLSNLGMT